MNQPSNNNQRTFSPPPPPSTPPTPPPIEAKKKSWPYSEATSGTIFTISFLWWLLGIPTLRYDSSSGPWNIWVLLHYFALGCAAFCFCDLTIRKCIGPARRKRRVWCLVFAFGIIILYAQVDSYTDRWVRVHASANKSSFQIHQSAWKLKLKGHTYTAYTDLRTRWGDSIYWRHMIICNDEGRTTWSSEGPMTNTNKPHGHWTEYSTLDYITEHKWYWYGEMISEGEWHLRNKH